MWGVGRKRGAVEVVEDQVGEFRWEVETGLENGGDLVEGKSILEGEAIVVVVGCEAAHSGALMKACTM